MRSPRDLQTTMTGWLSLQQLAIANQLVGQINGFINQLWPLPSFVKSWLTTAVSAVVNGVTQVLSGSADGVTDYLLAPVNALDQLTSVTAGALTSHNLSLVWLVNYDVPKAYNGALLNTGIQVRNAMNFATTLYNDAIIDITNTANQIYYNISQNVNALNARINAAQQAAAVALNAAQIALIDLINTRYNQAVEYTVSEINTVTNYFTGQVNSLKSDLTALAISTAAALAVAVNYLQDVFVPAAIAESVAAQNLLATEAVTVTWEAMATKANINLAEFVIVDPSTTWLVDETPEIPPIGIAAGLGELTNFGRRYIDVETNAVLPLYKNLHQFGEDLSQLGAVVTTLLVGGFTVAAVTEPETTAAVVADVLGGPLDSIATAIVNALAA